MRGRGGLTSRETEVVVLVARGLTNKEVGYRLQISERTVARHLIHIFSKLGVATRMAAAEEARARGLIEERPTEKPAVQVEVTSRGFLAAAPILLGSVRSAVMAPDNERHHQSP